MGRMKESDVANTNYKSVKGKIHKVKKDSNMEVIKRATFKGKSTGNQKRGKGKMAGILGDKSADEFIASLTNVTIERTKKMNRQNTTFAMEDINQDIKK